MWCLPGPAKPFRLPFRDAIHFVSALIYSGRAIYSVEGELSAAPRHPQYENEGSPPAMNRHLLIVAGGFYVAASAIALPALPGFLYFGLGAVRLRMLTPAPSTAASTSPDAMIGMIEMFARILGSLFRFAGAAGQWMMTALAALFFLALLVAGTLFFTGRGLQVHAGWARVLATLLLSGMLLVSLGGMLSLRRGLFPALAPMAAACIYAIWVMLRRFT
jgi:hypothetical protein